MTTKNISPTKTIFSVTQVIPDVVYNDLENLLCNMEWSNADETICFTANYPDTVDMDIKVVIIPDDLDDVGNSYIDAVLFVDGCEVACVVGESLEDVSVIDYDGTTYQFNIIKASVYNDFMSN